MIGSAGDISLFVWSDLRWVWISVCLVRLKVGVDEYNTGTVV